MGHREIEDRFSVGVYQKRDLVIVRGEGRPRLGRGRAGVRGLRGRDRRGQRRPLPPGRGCGHSGPGGSSHHLQRALLQRRPGAMSGAARPDHTGRDQPVLSLQFRHRGGRGRHQVRPDGHRPEARRRRHAGLPRQDTGLAQRHLGAQVQGAVRAAGARLLPRPLQQRRRIHRRHRRPDRRRDPGADPGRGRRASGHGGVPAGRSPSL